MTIVASGIYWRFSWWSLEREEIITSNTVFHGTRNLSGSECTAFKLTLQPSRKRFQTMLILGPVQTCSLKVSWTLFPPQMYIHVSILYFTFSGILGLPPTAITMCSAVRQDWNETTQAGHFKILIITQTSNLVSLSGSKLHCVCIRKGTTHIEIIHVTEWRGEDIECEMSV